MLRVPRACLKVTTSSRGLAFGPLCVLQRAGLQWTDCSSSEMSIPGDLQEIQNYRFASSARFLVVVEKDAVFQRLVQEGLCQATSSIIITARGMPDLATRLFLHMLITALPHLVPVAVVDWNPCGVAIMKIYKFGSNSLLEGTAWTLPGLQWLALRADQIDGLPATVFQPLSDHDRGVIRTLRHGPVGQLCGWMVEIDCMETNAAKVEIEAAYQANGFGAFARDLAFRLNHQQYI